MKFNKKLAALLSAFAVAVTMSGCAVAGGNDEIDDDVEISNRFPEQSPQPENPEEQPQLPSETPSEEQTPEEETPVGERVPATQEPDVNTISYIMVTADNVNIRTGAGTNYAVAGTAEKSTLYACLGEENGWYKTKYKNKTVYISSKYCVIVDMDKSNNEQVEAVIAEGTNLLGTPYVYGAVRLHDGNGHMLSGFTTSAFDCSSLMQYMFYNGAGKLLNVTTRTQIGQGTTVSKSNLQRGDLMFFTNASRKNNTGIERVGHVAIYLGDNYILHTASDYAKIEQISSTRWGYYIQAQRML